MQQYLGFVTQSQQRLNVKKAIADLKKIDVVSTSDYYTDFDQIDQFLRTL